MVRVGVGIPSPFCGTACRISAVIFFAVSFRRFVSPFRFAVSFRRFVSLFRFAVSFRCFVSLFRFAVSFRRSGS
jgi:hypothetical protein